VSRLGFGSTALAGLFQPTSKDDAARAIEAAWTNGLRYFDTAPQYGSGLAEQRVGAGLRNYARGDFVLSSKVGKLLRPPGSGIAPAALFPDGLPFDVVFDYSFDGTMRSLEESLERMGLDRVDILLIHDVNRRYHGGRVIEMLEAALAGSCRALTRLRDEKVIGGFGPALNDVDIALHFARECDIDCVMLPARYTLLDQSAAVELLPACLASGISLLVAGPFDSGILATGTVPDARYTYAAPPPAILDRVGRIDAVCRAFDVPLAAAALQFPLAHPAVASVVTGMRSAVEVEQNIALMRVEIPHEFWRALRRDKLLSDAAAVPQ
jgi:D-threo-aldose 1-dehydrogenase